jgi:uncharacterized protein
MLEPLNVRRADLVCLLESYERVVIGYSGGVDSTLLAAIGHEVLGRDAVSVTAVSPSLSKSELFGATQVATSRGWNHKTVVTRELEREEYARNSGDRCYWCKTELFEVLAPLADQHSARVAVGTNVDDLSDRRPGLVAATEWNVASPLVDAGLTKADVRELSRRMGLPTADKPSSPCLASRVAYGIRVTPQVLRRVETAERFVRNLGFSVVRVRDHGTLATVEVGGEQVARAIALRDEIITELKGLGYSDVDVDPEGYRMGSLNVPLISGA